MPKNIDSYLREENKITELKLFWNPSMFGETWLMRNFSFWSECPLMIQHLVSPKKSSDYLQLMFVQRQKIFEKSKANLKFYFLPI